MAIRWSTNWTPSRQHTVQYAWERLTRMLGSAYLSVKGTPDAQTMAIYNRHFNDRHNRGLGQRPTVINVVRLMYNRVATGEVVEMSYVPDDAAFMRLGLSLPPGVNFVNIEAFVVQKGVAPTQPLIVYIGPAFFTGNVYIPRAIDQRTGTGTILHELSHGVANTADHAYTWDTRNYPGLSAADRATNADTYRAFCQSFDTLY